MKLDGDIDFAIPSKLMAEILAAADDEHRPPSDIVRDALECYLAQSRKAMAHFAGKRPPAEAAAHMREARKGRFLPEGVTIRDLMAHGRA